MNTASNKRIGPPITVFTKPWQQLEIRQLADVVAGLGFDGVELPVRKGFQVEPDSIEDSLGNAIAVFKENGLEVYSVAGELDRRTARACARSGVSVLRTLLKLDPGKTYFENIHAFREQCLAISGDLEGSQTTIGLQNHCDAFVTSAIGLIHAIEPLPMDKVTAVLDLGHTGLEGEGEEIAIDIAWSRLSLINLKNAIRFPRGKDSKGATLWDRTWVRGPEGYTSWEEGIATLARRKYALPICLTAEYKDDSHFSLSGNAAIPPLKEDLAYLKQLIGEHYAVSS